VLWTSSSNPYIISGQLGIPSGVVLTIGPGVQVVYAAGSQIVVRGAVVVQGTAAAVVTFSPYTDGGAGATGFVFLGGANVSTSSFVYAQFSGLGTSVQMASAGGVSNVGVLSFQSVLLSTTSVALNGGTTYSSTAPTLASLQFTNSIVLSTSFISTWAWSGSEAVSFTACSITDSTLVSADSNHGFTISASQLLRTTLYQDCCGGGINVYNSSLNSSLVAHNVFSPSGYAGTTTLTGCTLFNTSLGGSGQTTSVTAVSSTFLFLSNNTCGTFSSLTLTNCSLVNAPPISFSAGFITSTGIIGSGAQVGLSASSALTVVASSISNYSTVVFIQAGVASASITNSTLLGVGAGPSPAPGNAATALGLYTFVTASSAAVTATSNWWGTPSASAVQASIYDGYINTNLGVVNFAPLQPAP